MDGRKILLNPDLVQSVDPGPDSRIQFRDGETLLVKESAQEIAQLILDYRQKIFVGPFRDILNHRLSLSEG